MMFQPDSKINFGSISSATLEQLARTMPKAELHMHIEGSLEPELMFTLAQKHGLSLGYASVDALRRAYDFSDLQSFLNIYYAGASVLQDEDDFYQMAYAYFRRAADDGVVHSEIFFDPQTHTERGVDIGVVFAGLRRAISQARTELGVSGSLIMCFLRHLPENAALETLELARPYLGDLIGVGLDSSEQGHPPEKFQVVFAKAKTLGLKLVAHAGEEGPPEYIWNALKLLQVQRVDHGVRCAEDDALVQELARTRLPLTVCPLSNVKLRVFNHLGEHNLGRLLDRGLCITLNSDDPAYFGGYINANFVQTLSALNLNARQIWQLAANSFEASFITESSKLAYLQQLNSHFLAAQA